MTPIAAPKFRIDVTINDLLTSASQRPPKPAEAKGLSLPDSVFPQFPDRLNDPGPEVPPEKRKWGLDYISRASRGWLFPYLRSRVMPGEFHPITAYLFIEYKCNLDCWYCWSYNNKVKGMTEVFVYRPESLVKSAFWRFGWTKGSVSATVGLDETGWSAHPRQAA